MAEVLILNDRDIEELVSFEEIMSVVEKAFADFQQGDSEVFPVVREEIKKHQGIFGIKSGYLKKEEVLGFKAGGFWLQNYAKDLTNHQSTMMLFDPCTGAPRALFAANYITKIRTAALGAVGCKYLARKDSKILTVIGAGLQGKNQLLATLKVLPGVQKVQVYDLNALAAEKMAGEMAQQIKPEIAYRDDVQSICENADVILTTTPSYQFIVRADWIKPGTHLNCIGSDTRGKQEIDPQIFTKAKIVVDNLEQCITIGETQHAFRQGLISKEDIHGEIGEIILGTKSGRSKPEEITVFDTTGVTIQDLATAGKIMEKAVILNKGQQVQI
ncbi:MAG: ornithine cyclodeaminase family protein [Peptococcaceae bacterium]